jgi:predicted transport protein
MPGGFRSSPLRLNSGLGQLEHWTAEEIERRAERLADIALQIWPAPNLSSETLARLVTVHAPTANNRAYTLENADYAANLQGPVFDLLQLLRQRILQLHPSVREEILKVYIAYKTNTNFVDVIPQRQRLILILNVRFPEIHDPLGLCRDITNLGRWGNGDVELMFSEAGQIDDVMALIKQSYERHAVTG